MTTTFWKGHGTGNDFVIVDRPAPLTSEQVRWLCHRRFGIGADGTLQALRAGEVADWDGDPDLWFMDYRNADGTIAEMCGNGLRVFARYLAQTGRITGDEADVATRAGVRHITLHDNGDVSVTMGTVRVENDEVTIEHQERWWPACKIDVGNPHAVVVTDHTTITSLNLDESPTWRPRSVFPHGANVEFVEQLDGHSVSMRVHERGSGETMSCGTGTVAVAATMATRTGHRGPWTVHVPGGHVIVTLSPADNGYAAVLRGPAVILATGKVSLPEK
ncbi:diaminopimelate epimerase [Cutibacterium sp.]|uniref:diaminopimelate epimerase n=1 Tax=Cutibacterium sp. TaxID=1912221 RepID=UPI0026DB08B0|nr:diaminopimelate epimerase [Cutibacterium sp.]MDO4411835.1 diaminopimelate epimerase [Cutibacterium sp.]